MTTTDIILIIYTVFLSVLFLSASSYGFYRMGADRIKSKMLVEMKRREKRLYFERNLWQTVYVKSKGGELKPKPPKEKDDAPARVISSPSTVVAELKEPVIQQQIPPKIAESFLTDTKKFT